MKTVVQTRCGLALALILLSACAALAQQNPDVQLQLSLANGKDFYRGGEPIVLELTFTVSLKLSAWGFCRAAI
jgi:hypothetical protein